MGSHLRRKTTFILLLLLGVISGAQAYKKVAYYPLWSNKALIEKINFTLPTHVNIESMFANADGSLRLWDERHEMLDSIVSKGHSAGIEVFITVGYDALTMGIVTDTTARHRFVRELVAYCVEHNLDGIDLDFEGSFDAEGYTQLAIELRESMPQSMALSTAVSSIHSNLYSDEFLAQCDWVNVMLYCMYGSWDSSPVKNHAAFEDFTTRAEAWAKHVPREDLILGTPLFGMTFADDGTMRKWGTKAWSGNEITYGMIRKYFPDSLMSDTTAGGFGLTLNDLNLDSAQLVSFNNDVCGDWDNSVPLTGDEELGLTYFSGPELSKRKVAWAQKNGFGGMMLCKLTQDVESEILTEIVTQDSIITSITPALSNDVHMHVLQSQKRGSTFTISNIPDNVQVVSMYDVKGREIDAFNMHQSGTLSITSPANGFYILLLQDINGTRVSTTVLVR